MKRLSGTCMQKVKSYELLNLSLCLKTSHLEKYYWTGVHSNVEIEGSKKLLSEKTGYLGKKSVAILIKSSLTKHS